MLPREIEATRHYPYWVIKKRAWWAKNKLRKTNLWSAFNFRFSYFL